MLPLMTMEKGTARSMTVQAAPVERPLGSAKRLCDSAHTVVFESDLSSIDNKVSIEYNILRKKRSWELHDRRVAYTGWIRLIPVVS